MKNKYRRTLSNLLIMSILFLISSGIQLLVNVMSGRTFFAVIFGLFVLFFAVYLTLIIMDMRLNDYKTMRVKITDVNDQIIRVRKPNGRLRKIRVAEDDENQYRVHQELELILTKRTGQINDIHVLADTN